MKVMIPSKTRNEGIHFVGSRGTGKSRYLGRILAINDFLAGVPTVVFDVEHVATNFLDKLTRELEAAGFTSSELDEVFERIVYVNMAGQKIGDDTYVVPFPIFTRFGDESGYEVAERFIHTIARMKPELLGAQVYGFGPLERLARAAGILIDAIGGTILDMAPMIRKGSTYNPKVMEAVRRDPYLQSSVDDMNEVERVDTLLNNLSLFHADPTVMAIFGARTRGIDWGEVIEKRQIVFLDFQELRVPSHRRFALTWTFWNLMDYLEYRGTNVDSPISVIVDEFGTLMKGQSEAAQRMFADDLDRLLNTVMRRHNIWLTLAHQNMAQFSDVVAEFLLDMGTQIIGRVGGMETALKLSKNFFPIDLLAVKRWEERIVPYVVPAGGGLYLSPPSAYIDTREYEIELTPVDKTIPDQIYERANKIQRLPKFTFYVRSAGLDPIKATIANLDEDQYPEQREGIIDAIRETSMVRDGVTVRDALSQLETPRTPPLRKVADGREPYVTEDRPQEPPPPGVHRRKRIIENDEQDTDNPS